jgi:glycosyltransferase involved in cell wall biosynthesis
MNKKSILIINSISLFPKIMASQDRIIEMAKRLSKDHKVDLATVISNDEELEKSQKNLKGICSNFYPIKKINPSDSIIRRKYYGLNFLLYNYLFALPKVYFYNRHYYEQIVRLQEQNNYDIIQAEYWYLGGVFQHIDNKVYKVIDTHDIAITIESLAFRKKYGQELPYFKKRELAKFEELEVKCLRLSDLLISITQDDYDQLTTISPDNDNIVIPTGQNIEYHLIDNPDPEPKTILFYGSMLSDQNIQAFFRLWNDIFPLVKEEIPDAKVLVVGSNPPKSIESLHNGKDITITGYVRDIRDYLPKGYLMVLPLEIGGGFRSRIIEVMAMGIPVIGTHNALDSVEMKNAVHGYITDDNKEIADRIIYLINNREKRDKMGGECIKFVKDKYTIESTYGKLSSYYRDLKIS